MDLINFLWDKSYFLKKIHHRIIDISSIGWGFITVVLCWDTCITHFSLEDMLRLSEAAHSIAP